jgi:hypothetical protein
MLVPGTTVFYVRLYGTVRMTLLYHSTDSSPVPGYCLYVRLPPPSPVRYRTWYIRYQGTVLPTVDYDYPMTVMSHAAGTYQVRYRCALRTTVRYCTNDSPVRLDGLLSFAVCTYDLTHSSSSPPTSSTVTLLPVDDGVV